MLAKVFDDADLSRNVLRSEHWRKGDEDWPTLSEMASLGRRLVVFNNVGMNEFPYSRLHMWNYVIENRYGSKGENVNVRITKVTFFVLCEIGRVKILFVNFRFDLVEILRKNI